MSSDWSVLSVDEQTEGVVIEALQEVVDAVDVRSDPDGRFLEMLDDHGVVLLVVERPKLVRTPSELARVAPGADISAPDGGRGLPDLVLPGTTDPSPVWWQDLHAATAVPRTDVFADALAHAIAVRTRGVVVMPRTVSEPPEIRETP